MPMWTLAASISVLLMQASAPAGPRAALYEVSVRQVDSRARRAWIAFPEGSESAPGPRLLLAAGDELVAWAELRGTENGESAFEVTTSEPLPSLGPWRAWLVAPDLVASLMATWPDRATLQTDVDSVGPGGQSAWLRAGTNDGVAAGDSWWLRVGGQPAARCDVLYVSPHLSFCTVVPLASAPAVHPGARAALWPAPAERRERRANSAVAYLEVRGNSILAWIAAPPNVECPPEPHVDFYRDGQYLGRGLVERRDSRFWYVRVVLVPGAPGNAAQRVLSSLPAGSLPVLVEVLPLRVGDEAVIRTQADIDERRFVAHIFELRPAGALLDVGEADGLTVGDALTVYRDGNAAGTVTVREVQRSYAVVTPVADGANVPFVLRIGDELRFRPPPPPPRVIGSIQRVVGETLFTARLTDAAPAVGTPMAVRASGRIVGVAVLVTAGETRGAGFVLPGSMTRPLAAGMQLVCAAEPPAGKDNP